MACKPLVVMNALAGSHVGRAGRDIVTKGRDGAGRMGRCAVQACAAVMLCAGPSTVSSARFTSADGPLAPSRPTMAPPARLSPGGASMPAIAQAGRTDEHTQHWPERGARTNAPCHTPHAAPPGLATRRHRKPAPVGPYAEHEDENRSANRVYGAAWHVGVSKEVCMTRSVVTWVCKSACGARERALTGVTNPKPRPPSARLAVLPPHAALPSLRPDEVGPQARSRIPQLPIHILFPLVVCVNA